jgi:hypothetical protein
MGLRQGHLEFSDSGALDSSKPVSASTPENGLMTDTGITMRVIPTTVSVGAIGISDTTGINRQNRKNSYIPSNRQSLPAARRVRIAAPGAWLETADCGVWLSGCKHQCQLQNAACSAASTNESATEQNFPFRSCNELSEAADHENFANNHPLGPMSIYTTPTQEIHSPRGESSPSEERGSVAKYRSVRADCPSEPPPRKLASSLATLPRECENVVSIPMPGS